MRKICCLLLLLMLCMSTTYAARGDIANGKECMKYLYGCWAILNSNMYYYFDDKGFIKPLGSEDNMPKIAYRYKYQRITDDSYFDNKGHGCITIVCTDGLTRSIIFDNLKQFRIGTDIRGLILTCIKVSDNVQGNIPQDMKIIDYDTIAEPEYPLEGVYKKNYTFLYTPEHNAEQMKIITSEKDNSVIINIYDKSSQLKYTHSFPKNTITQMRKIFLRPGKSDLMFFSYNIMSGDIEDFIIVGKNEKEITNIYDIKDKKVKFAGGYFPKVEYNGIHFNKYNRYDGRIDTTGQKWIIVPTKLKQEYTYKIMTYDSFKKNKTAGATKIKPVL